MKKILLSAVAAVFAVVAVAAPKYSVELKAIGYTGNETLENFPVLLKLSESNISGFHYSDLTQANNGGDIWFSSDAAGLHPIPHDIDEWNANGESLIWVSVPALTATTPFYMHYKDATPPTYAPSNVWLNASYVGVWHMSEASGNVADATGNGLTAVPRGTYANDDSVREDAGAIGGCRQNSTRVRASGNNTAWLKVTNSKTLISGGKATLSCWIKFRTNTENANSRVFSSKNGYTDGSGFCGETAKDGGSITLRSGGGGGYGLTFSSYGNWNHMVVSYDVTAMKAWHNGGAHSGSWSATSIGNIATDIGLGSNRTGSEPALNGWMDEYRLRAVPSSAAWAKAEYDTATSASFITAGSIIDNDAVVAVVGDPANYGTPNPAYGLSSGKVIGTEYTFTAPAAIYENAEETIRWNCTGWQLLDSVTKVEDSHGDTASCTFTFAKPMTLIWSWAKEIKVTVGDTAYWVAENGTFNYAAPAVEGRSFYGWNDVDNVLADTSLGSVSFTVTKPVTLIPMYVGDETATKTFVGTNNGLWNSASNWEPAGIPTLLDDVVIPNGKRVNAPECIYVNSITLNGSGAISQCGATTAADESIQYTSGSGYGTRSDYGRRAADFASTREVKSVVIGNVTMNGSSQWLVGGHSSSAYKTVSIGGDFTMADTSLFAVYAGPGDMANEPEKGGALVKVGGMTTIGASAIVDAFCNTAIYSEGAAGHRGTGAYVLFELEDTSIAGNVRSRIGVTEYSDTALRALGVTGDGGTGQLYGGGHGGIGGGISEAKPVGGAAYDYELSPILPGAPGTFARTWGGGVIRIDAKNFDLTGTLNANVGYTGNQHERSQGAGGSIWVTCTNYTLGANAKLTAKGGEAVPFNSYTPGGGGGGRIAIATELTAAQKTSLARTGTCGDISPTTDLSVLHPGKTDVSGGAGKNGGQDGASGTAVYYRWIDPNQLVVNIRSNPEGLMGEFDPANGTEVAAVRGETFNATAPEYALVDATKRYRLTGWTATVGNETVASGSGTSAAIANMQNSVVLTWNYSEAQYYVDFQTAGPGTLDKASGWFAEGTEVTVNATGSLFGWMIGEYLTPDATKASSYTFTVTKPRQIGAVFAGPKSALTAKTYVGESNGDWNTASNWNPAGVPQFCDAVIIPASTVVRVPETALAGSLSLGAGATLSVYGLTSGWSNNDNNHAYGDSGNPTRGTIGRQALDFLALDCYPSVEVAGDITLGEGAMLIVGGYWQRAQSVLAAGGNLSVGENARIAVYAGELVPAKGITMATGTAKIVVGGTFTLEDGAWLSLIAELAQYDYPGHGTLSSVAIEAGEFVEKAGAKVTSYFGSNPYVNNTIGVGGETGNLGCHGGSGHGGNGGAGSAYGGAAFDLAEFPIYPGPCGRYYYMGSAGGGVIRIVADNVSIAGTNDVSAVYDNSFEGGGAAGGSINIRSRKSLTVAPTALFKADGRKASLYSTHVCGGGAGGRIALLRGISDDVADMLITQDSALVTKALRSCKVIDQIAEGAQFAAQMSVAPGVGANGGEPGEAGTAVLIKSTGFLLMLR